MQPTLLLIGFKQDPHLRELAELAGQAAYKAVILDPAGDEDAVVCGFGRGDGVSLYVEGEKLDLEAVAGVWLRHKPLVQHPGWSPLELAAATFKQDEWRVALRYLSEVLAPAVWINPLARQAAVNCKPGQLRLARDCGLHVPETRITNRLEDVLELFNSHERVIYKTLSWASFPDQTGILTNAVDRSFVLENGDSVSRCPGIFQQCVEKEYEYRVTVVGGRVYTAVVQSNATPEASVDWRRAHLDNIFEAGELAPETESRLLSFHERAGLAYGAYDLIHSTDGRDYFLECNPAGQYLWLKHKCGIDITPAILEYFDGRARSPGH
ncbi:hypothetical protein [Desulfocurvus sp. DL9XJH121]